MSAKYSKQLLKRRKIVNITDELKNKEIKMKMT